MVIVTEESDAGGPWALVAELESWATATSWVIWLELSGSLGRGAGDRHSDVDAGIGVSEVGCLDSIEAAMSAFGPVAARVREPFGADMTHLITVYRDGRQLSLVVMPEDGRRGLPPEAMALVDKAGHLSENLDRTRWDPDDTEMRRWTFMSCLGAADALRHAARGRMWRAIRSLSEARDLYLQLVAAREGVVFPQFGAVSLENADRPIPLTLAQTLPTSLNPGAVASSVRALMRHLQPLVDTYALTSLASALNLTAR
ncbi:MAG: hypothetical protein ACTHON_16740 [Humibacter sp.]